MTIRSEAELPGLQMLRALAAIAVVVHHVLRRLDTLPGQFSPEWLTLAMSSGVDVFFVLSGFMMVRVAFGAERAAASPVDFLLRRVVRIYPLYVVCCLGLLGAQAIGVLHLCAFAPGEIVSSLALMPSGRPILFVAWTLTFEMLFYAIFAASLVFASRARAVAATSLVIAGLVGCGVGGTGRTALGNPIALEFAFGLGLGLLVRSTRDWRGRRTIRYAAAAAMLAAPIVVPHASVAFLVDPYRTLVWGIPAVAIVASFAATARPRRWPGRLLVQIGDASYSLYLTHGFLALGYTRLLKNPSVSALPQIAVAPLVVLASIAVGLAVHRFVETPLLRLLKPPKRERRGARPALAASSWAIVPSSRSAGVAR